MTTRATIDVDSIPISYLTAGEASEAKIAEYLAPWTDPRVARSWLALAGAADNRYTLELLPGLRKSTTPKLLVWGEDDQFQTVGSCRALRGRDPGDQTSPYPPRRSHTNGERTVSCCTCAR